MVFFPFIEWFNQLIEWMKKQGSPAYWIWMFFIGMFIGLPLVICTEAKVTPWQDPIGKKTLIAGLIWWFGGAPFIYLYERKRKSGEKKK